MLSSLTVLTALVLSAQPAGPPPDTGAAIPDWYREHVAYMSGRWETDNSAYRSEQETYDTYVIVFEPRFDGTGMRGELFGLSDGERSATFWEFSSWWDPDAGEAVLVQHGWGGSLGIGTIGPLADGDYTAEQDFHTPGRPDRRERHDFDVVDADTHETRSIRISPDGSETPGRHYVWQRTD
jgi:hypothetical protein